MVTKTVMMTQQNVEHPHLPAAGGAASSSITQTLLSNSPPNSPVIVSASKLREEEKRLQMVRISKIKDHIDSYSFNQVWKMTYYKNKLIYDRLICL